MPDLIRNRWATLKKLHEGLKLSDFGFIAASGGVAVGTDLAGMFEGMMYLLFGLSLLALMFIYHKVDQKVTDGEKISDDWRHAYFIAVGAGAISLVIMIIGLTQVSHDDSQDDHNSILRNLSKDTTEMRSDVRQTNLLLEAESVGQKLYAEVD